jgi:hypothetical protein
MNTIEKINKKLAIATISLPLVRSGYNVEIDVPADEIVLGLVAERFTNGKSDRFVIEIHFAPDPSNPPKRSRDYAQEVFKTTNLKTYFALVFDNGKKVRADQYLVDRMLFSTKDLQVESFDGPSLSY